MKGKSPGSVSLLKELLSLDGMAGNKYVGEIASTVADKETAHLFSVSKLRDWEAFFAGIGTVSKFRSATYILDIQSASAPNWGIFRCTSTPLEPSAFSMRLDEIV